MICIDCKCSFVEKGSWQIRCIDCFKKIKQNELLMLKSRIVQLERELRSTKCNLDAKFLLAKLIELRKDKKSRNYSDWN